MQAARDHAVESPENNRVLHTSLDGKTTIQRVNATGYCAKYDYISENVQGVGGGSTPQQNFDRWVASEGHRANIERPRFLEVGIASEYVANTGPGSGPFDYMVGWVVDFADPCPAPIDTPPADNTDPSTDTGEIPIIGDAPIVDPAPIVELTISAKAKMTTRASRPVVNAVVRDRDSNLRRGNIVVKLDGRVARKGVRYAVVSESSPFGPSSRSRQADTR